MMQILQLLTSCLFAVAAGSRVRFLQEGLGHRRASLFASPENVNVPPKAWPQPGMGTAQNPSVGNSTQKSGGKSDNALEAATREFHHTREKAFQMNPVQMVKNDVNLMMDYLMPGQRPDLGARKGDFVLVLIATVWFVAYTQFILQNDRAEHLSRWSKVPRHQIRDCFDMHPDLVLVFHHPDHNYDDNDTLISRHTILQALVSCREDVEGGHEFQRTHGLLRRASLGPALLARPFSPSGRLSPKSDSPEQDVTMHQVRAALLQDVYQVLSDETAGFFIDVFSSVDADELHVCISLHSAKTIRRQLELNAMKLQLQNGIVQKILGIDQPIDQDESSPPFVQYSEALSEQVMGYRHADFDLFQVYGKAATRSGKGTILTGQQRIQLVYKYLNRRLDLDFAVSKGLLVQWFPAHNTGRLADLTACWARWGLMLDLTFVQPVTLLNDYFSSRVAFIFAWNGHHCKLLFALTPVAVAFEFANLVLWKHGSVLGFGIILAVWGRWALNSWAREQEYFCTLWDLKDSHKDKSRRADFKGTPQPSDVDGNVQEMYYETWKYTGRMCLSWLLTGVAIAVNFTILLLWMDLWQGRMPIGAIVVQAIIVQSFTIFFNWMAEALTNAENHKYQENFYNSYLSKMFIFQFGNQYSAYFYIAVKQQFTTLRCQNDDCVGVMRQQLPPMLMFLAIMRVVQVVLATLKVEYKLWKETQDYIREGGEVPDYCFVERQSKFDKFRIREQIEVMTQLTITLGYVLIFGAIAPGIVPLCFVVFVVQLRADAITVTTATNRTVPRVAQGIGVWMSVVKFLTIVGIVFSGYLMVQFEPLFFGANVLTKLSCMILFCSLLFMLCFSLDLLVPKHSNRTEILQARRDYSARKLREIVERKTHPRQMLESVPLSRESGHWKNVRYCSEVQNGEWSGIPKANDVSRKTLTTSSSIAEEESDD